MLGAGRIFLGVAALLVFLLPLVSSALHCSVTQQPDGSFMYELSEPHDSSCDVSWADVHGTVIALDSGRNETLVQALNNQSITMKTCSDFLLFSKDCLEALVTTTCSVNCTRLLEQRERERESSRARKDPVNPNLTSSTDDRCLDHVTFGLYVSAAVLSFIAVIDALF